ncbi:uncharacterized protein [Danio rerio]|uniref:Uncharacterized protein n=1 Tax=Danio rerio TaxID=7955 RepID=A0AB32U4H6_DANRE
MALFIFITFQLLLEVVQQASTENATSFSESVSVTATGLAVVTSLPLTPENDTYTMTITETSKASTDLAITSSAEVMTDSETNMPNLTTHDSHHFNSSANTTLESTTLIKTTKDTSVFTLINEGLESENKSNKRMFFLVAVAATGGGIFLTGLIGIFLYGCTRKPKAQSIWFESRRKKQEVTLPVTGSDSIEEDSVVYSTVKFIESTSPTAEITEGSNQTEQESNALFYTILTQPPVSSDCETVYSQVTVL